jgi:hypothetical protein
MPIKPLKISTLKTSLFFILLTNLCLAQDIKKNWVGVNTSVFEDAVIRFSGPTDDDASHDGKLGFSVGFDYLRNLSKRLDLETGLNYSRHAIDFSYLNYTDHLVDTLIPIHIDFISIPLNLRIKMKWGLIISFGIQYDQTIKEVNGRYLHNQTGIGFNLKFGKDFKLTDKMSLFIAPEIIMHGLVPFHRDSNQFGIGLNNKKLTELGLRIGYKFGL